MKHTYLNRSFVAVPSVTTIISQLDKPYLLRWANVLGLRGFAFEAVRNRAADTGTLAHTMVENYINGITQDYSGHPLFVPANRSFCAFRDWLDGKTVRFLGSEVSLVDEMMGYGGTIDIIAEIEGRVCAVDIKTSNRFSVDYDYQISAYSMLLENGELDSQGKSRNFPLYKPQAALLLRLDKKTGTFEERWLSSEQIQRSQEIFKHLLHLYQLRSNYDPSSL